MNKLMLWVAVRQLETAAEILHLLGYLVEAETLDSIAANINADRTDSAP